MKINIDSIVWGALSGERADTTLAFTLNYSKEAQNFRFATEGCRSQDYSSLYIYVNPATEALTAFHYQTDYETFEGYGRSYTHRAVYEVRKGDMASIGFKRSLLLEHFTRLHPYSVRVVNASSEAVIPDAKIKSDAAKSLNANEQKLAQAIEFAVFAGSKVCIRIGSENLYGEKLLDDPRLRQILNAMDSQTELVRRVSSLGFAINRASEVTSRLGEHLLVNVHCDDISEWNVSKGNDVVLDWTGAELKGNIPALKEEAKAAKESIEKLMEPLTGGAILTLPVVTSLYSQIPQRIDEIFGKDELTANDSEIIEVIERVAGGCYGYDRVVEIKRKIALNNARSIKELDDVLRKYGEKALPGILEKVRKNDALKTACGENNNLNIATFLQEEIRTWAKKQPNADKIRLFKNAYFGIELSDLNIDSWETLCEICRILKDNKKQVLIANPLNKLTRKGFGLNVFADVAPYIMPEDQKALLSRVWEMGSLVKYAKAVKSYGKDIRVILDWDLSPTTEIGDEEELSKALEELSKTAGLKPVAARIAERKEDILRSKRPEDFKELVMTIEEAPSVLTTYDTEEELLDLCSTDKQSDFEQLRQILSAVGKTEDPESFVGKHKALESLLQTLAIKSALSWFADTTDITQDKADKKAVNHVVKAIEGYGENDLQALFHAIIPKKDTDTKDEQNAGEEKNTERKFSYVQRRVISALSAELKKKKMDTEAEALDALVPGWKNSVRNLADGMHNKLNMKAAGILCAVILGIAGLVLAISNVDLSNSKGSAPVVQDYVDHPDSLHIAMLYNDTVVVERNDTAWGFHPIAFLADTLGNMAFSNTVALDEILLVHGLYYTGDSIQTRDSLFNERYEAKLKLTDPTLLWPLDSAFISRIKFESPTSLAVAMKSGKDTINVRATFDNPLIKQLKDSVQWGEATALWFMIDDIEDTRTQLPEEEFVKLNGCKRPVRNTAYYLWMVNQIEKARKDNEIDKLIPY